MNKISLEERVRNLRNLGQSIRQEHDVLSEALAREVGTSMAHSDFELDLAVKALQSFVEELPYLENRVPAGKIAVIIPYNAIGILLAMSLGAAYLAGNEVHLKFSSKTRKTAQLFEDLIRKDLGDHVTFGHESGRGFVHEHLQSPDTRVIQVYGHDSWMTGYREAVRESNKKLIFEGPGKDPCIVLRDADLNHSGEILRGCYSNSGQLCMSLERFYVHKSIQEGFLDKIVRITKSMTIGDSRNRSTDIGPILSQRVVKTIEEQLADAREKGAELIHGGRSWEAMIDGQTVYFVEPAILIGVSAGMKIMQEETFGPIVPIQSFSEPEEALSLANNCVYALGSCVFGVRDADYVAQRLRRTHGFCLLNSIYLTSFDAHAPWGGYKRSGWIWETVDGEFIERTGPKRLVVEFTAPAAL
jgi:acyl-CoA reductase-like NAD-dependent aldehyde dehydrogenase